MGIHTQKTVFCDEDGCHVWVEAEHKKVPEIVGEFRKRGWRFKDGRFTCPKCLKEGK